MKGICLLMNTIGRGGGGKRCKAASASIHNYYNINYSYSSIVGLKK